MENMFKFLLKIRWIVILLVFAFTVFFAYQIPSIRINSDVISSLPDNDPDAALLKKIGEEFGGNRIGMVILECNNVFSIEVLEHVRQITDTLSKIEGISSVTSLTNIVDIKEDESGMEVGKLIDEYNFPVTDEELLQLRERALSKDMYKGVIVSENGKATSIIFSLFDNADIQRVASAVKEKTEKLRLPWKIYYAGSPMMITSIADLISADLTRLLPVAFFLIGVVLLFGFRSVRGVILPLSTATIAIIWVLGIMSLAGSEMSMVSNNIPIVLLAIGAAYAIHVLNRISQLKADLKKAIIKALAYVTVPIILAALTTMAGFVSFIFGSYLTMIRDFGIYTALGTFISLVLSLFFVPPVISILPWNIGSRSLRKGGKSKSYLSDYFLVPLQKFLYYHTKRILVIWIILTVVGIGGIFLIKRNVDIRNYFKKGNPTRVAEDIMNREFGGTKPVFVLFRGDIKSPEILNKMISAEEYMKKSPGIMSAQSIADLIVEINAAFGEGRRIPDEKDKIEQLWFLLEGNESIQKLVSEEENEAIIISKFILSDNQSKKEFADYMDQFIRQNSTESCTIEITGMPFIDLTMDKSLIRSQAGSLGFALLFVIIIVGAILRSLTSGVYAAIPILSTIIILFGVMGFTGIPLNIATVLVASIAMGVGIDYSIHVITHFNHSLGKGDTILDALNDTIAISGKAIVINVISVSAGFLVMLFSEMVPLQYFGLLISLSMVGSGLSAIILLPVILVLSHRKWNSIHSNKNLKN